MLSAQVFPKVESDAVTSTSGAGLAEADTVSFSAGLAAMVCGPVPSLLGGARKNQPVAITIAVTTLANIIPAAFRIVSLPKNPAPFALGY